MSSDVRQLLGDLAVASVELVAAPVPRTLTDWYVLAEPWLGLAIATGIAVGANPHEVTGELVDLLADAFDDTR